MARARRGLPCYPLPCYPKPMLAIPTAPWAHYIGDGAAWACGTLAAWAQHRAYPAQTRRLAKVTGPGYYQVLAISALAGAWLLGSLNTVRVGLAPSHSIAGALAGGIFGVELWKWRQGIRGSTGGAFVLPLLAFAIVGGVLGGTGLRRSGRSLVPFGGSVTEVALSTIAVAIAASALLSGLLGAGAAGIAHSAGDPPRVADMVLSGRSSALAGGSYAAVFCLGASWTLRGGGRFLVLALDWILGGSDRAGALLTPRAHVRNLLGGNAPFDFSQRKSAVALVIVGVTSVVLALVFVQRRGRDLT